MAADDVAAGVARAAVGAPSSGISEIGGPEQLRFEEAVRRVLTAAEDPREVVADPGATYVRIPVTERSLIPGEAARLGEIRLEDWLRESAATKAPVATGGRT